ncbi:MAG: S8 family serine peptidase, partial [Clostridia bacterium]|nr:S8 family serine peptidase [Clostridia bacterium]
MFKKIISLFVSYSLICSAMLCVTANSDEFTFTKVDKLPQPDTINYSRNEKVMFIIEVEGDPLLSDNTIATFGGDFLQSRVKTMMTEEILANQAEIVDNIQEEIPEISEPDYVYTALFNGFAIEGERSDEEKLLNIPGVKNVYIAGEIEATPKLTDSIGLSHALPEEISDYTGEGQAIAVIDNEFDCSHEMFSQAPQNPKYTREDIENLLPSLSIKSKATVDTVYKSEKIPFAFNYISGNGKTYSSTLCHGTHVAGIAAGNNGKGLTGVAPNAQLVLMKVAKANGGMPEYALLQALNDAALLGVCAINCSFGIDYTSASTVSSAWQTSVNNAKTAGIYI